MQAHAVKSYREGEKEKERSLLSIKAEKRTEQRAVLKTDKWKEIQSDRQAKHIQNKITNKIFFYRLGFR